MNSIAKTGLVSSWPELSLKKLFLASFVVGMLAIVVCAYFSDVPIMRVMGVVVSATCILAYAAIGSRQAGIGKSQTIDQVADSSYYLGFLFTLTALITALANLAFNSNIDDESIAVLISSFALALSTTIVGLICKILLSQFDSTLSQQKSKAMGDLTKATTQFSTKLTNSTYKIDHYLETAEARIRTTNEEAVKQLLDISKTHTAELTDQLQAFNSSNEESVKKTFDATQAIVTKINSNTESFGSQLDGLMMGLKQIQTDLSVTSTDFGSSIKTSTSVLNEFADSIKQIGDVLEKQNEQIGALNTTSIKLAKRMEQDQDDLDKTQLSLEQIRGDSSEISGSFNEIQKTLESAATSLATFVSGIPDKSQTNDYFADLERTMSKCTSTIEGLHQACGVFEQKIHQINSDMRPHGKRKTGLLRGFFGNRNR